MSATLFAKIWDAHSVAGNLIAIDRVFLHERTGSVALKELAAARRHVRNPEQVFCTMDHIVDTLPGRTDNTRMPGGIEFITQTREAARAARINLFDLGDGQESYEKGVARVRCPTLVIGVQSDILFPCWQQREVADLLRAAGTPVTHVELDAPYGHDTFLIDLERVGGAVRVHLEA